MKNDEEDKLTLEEPVYAKEKKNHSEDVSLAQHSFNIDNKDKVAAGSSVNRSTVNSEKDCNPCIMERCIKKFLKSGELSFSEYNKEMDENTNISDDDEDDVIEDSIEEFTPHREKSKSRASKHFEAELHKTRKDAMRGNLKGRVKMRDGRQRRRCVLPAALQGLVGRTDNLCISVLCVTFFIFIKCVESF